MHAGSCTQGHARRIMHAGTCTQEHAHRNKHTGTSTQEQARRYKHAGTSTQDHTHRNIHAGSTRTATRPTNRTSRPRLTRAPRCRSEGVARPERRVFSRGRDEICVLTSKYSPNPGTRACTCCSSYIHTFGQPCGSIHDLFDGPALH